MPWGPVLKLFFMKKSICKSRKRCTDLPKNAPIKKCAKRAFQTHTKNVGTKI